MKNYCFYSIECFLRGNNRSNRINASCFGLYSDSATELSLVYICIDMCNACLSRVCVCALNRLLGGGAMGSGGGLNVPHVCQACAPVVIFSVFATTSTVP